MTYCFRETDNNANVTVLFVPRVAFT